jgi:hypothetical protein
MIKKLKDILGIEGAKIDISVPEELDLNESVLVGEVLLTSQSDKIVEGLEIKLIEKYKRGKKDSLLVDEYVLGHIKLDLMIPILANQEERLDFTLPYNKVLSEMDRIQDSNFIGGLLVSMAKKLKGVKSIYRVEATAYIKGTKLNPSVAKKIPVK